MTSILIFLALALSVVLILVSFVVYKANKFKNKVEDAVVDGVKELIVEGTPKAVKYVKSKIDKK